jgi:hypothetical protein
MRYPNLIWAMSRCGPRYRFAATIDHSEAWLSRRLSGRIDFSQPERERIAVALGYPAEWLFQEPSPPKSGRTTCNSGDAL